MKAATCPKCGSDHSSVPKFTWYGGLVGQKIIGHRKCENCNYQYVKGGNHVDLWLRIALYTGVGFILVTVIIIAMIYFFFFLA